MSTFPPPGPMAERDVGVRATGYWIGALMMVAGVVLGIVVIALGVSRAVDAFAFPDVVDASGGVWVDEPGGHVIFVVGPVRTANQFVPIPNVVVTGPDGDTVPTAPYSGSRSTTGVDASGMNREAVAVATFEASQAGRYHLSASDLDYGSTLAVGEGVDGNFGSFALGGLGGGLLVLGGLVVVIVTAVRRHRRPPTYPGGYGYPGMPYPGAPYPGAPYPGAPYPGAPYPAPGSLAPPAASSAPMPGSPAQPPGPVWYPPAAPPSGPGSPAGPPGAWWTTPPSGGSPETGGDRPPEQTFPER